MREEQEMAQNGEQQVTLTIGGMNCGGCAARVQETLAKVAGVSDAQVSLAQGEAVVRYDPDRTDASALVTALATAGYAVAPLSERVA